MVTPHPAFMSVIRWIVLPALAGLVVATAASAQQARTRPGDNAGAAPSVTWPDGTSWRHLGPAAFGGRIDDIEAVADDPRIIFVGAASGGLFRSVNNGVTW